MRSRLRSIGKAARPPAPGGQPQPQPEGPGTTKPTPASPPRATGRRIGRRDHGKRARRTQRQASPYPMPLRQGQETVIAHAADRAVEEAQQHHEAPDLEPESIDESDAGDSEGSDDER